MGQSSFYQNNQGQGGNDDAGHQQREEALRARINEGIANTIAASHGKAAPEGCFTYTAADHAFMGLTSDNRNAFYAVPKIFQGRTPAEQMAELETRTGATLLQGDKVSLDSIHEGMVIGIGSGAGGDPGVTDVQRTGVVYRDPKTQQLMFAESTAAGKLEQRPVSELLDDAKANNKKLFAGDLTTLAENMGARPTVYTHEAGHRAVKAGKNSRFTPPGTSDAPETNTAPESDSMTALRRDISAGIEATVTNAMHNGVRYHMGSNNARFIDCSSFVGRCADSAFTQMTRNGKPVRGAPIDLHNISENQIDNVFKKTGFMLQGNDVNAGNLREGMIIGIDTGKHSWDGGRQRGIDHIAAVYRDSKTGKMMVAESVGCKDSHTHHSGPRTMELDAWLARAHRIWGSKLHMFATDLALLADKMGLASANPLPATQVAATRTATPTAPAVS